MFYICLVNGSSGIEKIFPTHTTTKIFYYCGFVYFIQPKPQGEEIKILLPPAAVPPEAVALLLPQ